MFFRESRFAKYQAVIHFSRRKRRSSSYEARRLSRAFIDFCLGWGVYVDFMRLGAVNLDFLRIPVIRQTLRQDTLIRRSLARSLLRSANRRRCFKLRRRLNISIPDPRHSGEVRIKSTFPVLFPALFAETKNCRRAPRLQKQNSLSPQSRENEKRPL